MKVSKKEFNLMANDFYEMCKDLKLNDVNLTHYKNLMIRLFDQTIGKLGENNAIKKRKE